MPVGGMVRHTRSTKARAAKRATASSIAHRLIPAPGASKERAAIPWAQLSVPQVLQPLAIARAVTRLIPRGLPVPAVPPLPALPQGGSVPPITGGGSPDSPGAPVAFLLVFGTLGVLAWRALSYGPLRLAQVGFGSVLVPPG